MKKKKYCFPQKPLKKIAKWEYSLRLLLMGLVGSGGGAYASTPIGLVGGQTADSAGYAALLPNATGDVVPVVGFPENTTIKSVSMNIHGAGLVGGQTAGAIPYCASIAADGTLTSRNPLISAGDILSVAISETGYGLMGGRDNGLNNGYVAQVLADGTVISYAAADIIEAVAINDSDIGLIGGEGGAQAYVAYVYKDGPGPQFPNTPGPPSHIYAVAINELGMGLVGGIGDGFASSYAAFVTPGGSFPLVLSPLPAGSPATIGAVAINKSGSGLIGGLDGGSNAYAGYATPDGNVLPLFDTPFPGIITRVALNDSGVGLIGGRSGSNLYAAFVQSNGTVTPLFSTPVVGQINAVALNSAGVGLIGGQTDGSTAYGALVAPNGALTPLSIFNGATINSVALQSQKILNQVTPESVGPYGSVIYMQLAAASALETRFIQKNRVWAKMRKKRATTAHKAGHEMHLAQNEIDPSYIALGSPSKRASSELETRSSRKPHSLWLEPFGSFIHLKKEGAIPSFTNEIAGGLLGYDWQGCNYLMGATLGYGFNYVDYSNDMGHAKIQEEIASLYGAYYGDCFWAAATLWGGLYQFTNTRHPLPEITSTGKSHGFVLAPHLELARPWAIDHTGCQFVELFIQFDWVNNWQHHYTESGSSGLNLQVPSLYNSLLQSEAGFRFYERLVYRWGDVRLEEKLSYINMAPFNVSGVDTSFVSSASTFPVAIGSADMQNLGSFQFLAAFVPRKCSCPYGGFAFQASVGSSFQSYYVSLFGGINF